MQHPRLDFDLSPEWRGCSSDTWALFWRDMGNGCCWRLRYVNKAGQQSASRNPTGDHHKQPWKMQCALRSVQEEDAPVIQASGSLSGLDEKDHRGFGVAAATESR